MLSLADLVFQVVLLGSGLSIDPNIQPVFHDDATGEFRSCLFTFTSVPKERGPVYSVDVQNRRAVRYSRSCVRDVEREASPTALLFVPDRAHSDRW